MSEKSIIVVLISKTMPGKIFQSSLLFFPPPLTKLIIYFFFFLFLMTLYIKYVTQNNNTCKNKNQLLNAA